MVTGLLLAFSGFTALCFARTRQASLQSMNFSRYGAWLRAAGTLLLALSLLACLHSGGGIGLVAWFGLLSLAALLLIFLLPYWPRHILLAAYVAPCAALLWWLFSR